MVEAIDVQSWQLVPALVRYRFGVADAAAAALTKCAVDAWYSPQDASLFVHGSLPEGFQAAGLRTVPVTAMMEPHGELIQIKSAAPLGWLQAPFNWGGTMAGGPSPLSNAIVGGLLAGGLGYGTGAWLEHIFPERYVQRGRLRKTLGLLGLGLGAVPGAMQWRANYLNRTAGRDPSNATWATVGKSLIAPNRSTPSNTQSRQQLRRYDSYDDQSPVMPALPDSLKAMPLDPMYQSGVEKIAMGFATHDTGGNVRPVPVDGFNRAIWNDVRPTSAGLNPFGTRSQWGDPQAQMHTPAHVAAAASGLVTGIQSQYGGAPLLSGRHFISGLVNAGVDLGRAHVAGSVLGALGGLSPQGQQTLQDMGLWGGMIRGVVGSVLGMR